MDFAIQEGPVLHVHVGDRCNNRCVFCNEDSAVRTERVKGTGLADVEQVLDEHPNVEEVLFTCGEPTLRVELPDFVSAAARRSFRRVALITNGRVLGRPGYLADLTERGLNSVSVSIHGHVPEVHDRLTGRVGSFAQASEGLAAVAAIRRAGGGLAFSINSVATRANVAHLSAMHQYFARFEPDEWVLNALSPRSRGEENYEDVSVPFFEVMEALAPLNRLFLDPPLRVLEIPHCVLVRAGFVHTGGREGWLVYEKGVDGIETTEAMHPLFLKADFCVDCVLNADCEGIYRRYDEVYGREEFGPVATNDLFRGPVRELLRPLEPGSEVAGGWRLDDVSLRRKRGVVLVALRHEDGRALQLGLKKTREGLRMVPLGPVNLPEFRRQNAAVLHRLSAVIAANVSVLL